MTLTPALNGQQPQRVREALPADMATVQQPRNQVGLAKMESVFTLALAALYANQPRHMLKTTEKHVIIMTFIGTTQRARYKAYMKIAKTVA